MVLRKLSPVPAALALVLAVRCGGITQPELPPPAITSFTAAKSLIGAGDSTTLTAQFTGGAGVINQGVGPVVAGLPVTVQPPVSTTYTLVVSAASAPPAQSQVTVTVAPAPTEPVIQPPATVGPGQTGLTASVTPQAGCTYQWSLDPEGGTITAGANEPTVTFDTAAFGVLTLSCTVTNAAGKSATSTPLSFPLGGPEATSFSADPPTLTEGGSSVLAFGFSGGTAVLSSPGAPDQTLSPGETSLEVTPAATTTYTLTVTAGNGESTSLEAMVTVVPLPVIQQFSAGAAIIGTGTSTQLTAVFQAGPGATATVDNGVGAVDSQASVPTGTLERTTVFTLTVTNAAGKEATAQAKVWVGSLAALAGVPSGEGSADGTAARFVDPTGVAQDSAGHFLVADTHSHTIRRIDPTGTVSTLAGEEGEPGSADGQGDEARFNLPMGVAVDPSGNLVVADSGNGSIRLVTPGGAVSTLATGLNNPTAVALGQDANGNNLVYVADTGSSTIRRVPTDGSAVSILAGQADNPGSQDGPPAQAQFNAPAGLALDSQAEPPALYVADAGNNSIRVVSLDDDSVTTLDDSAAGFRNPQGLALDAVNGVLYVADTGNSAVCRITLDDASVALLAGTPGDPGSGNAPARFNLPQGVALAANGNLVVADTGNATVRAIAPDGTVSTLSGQAGSEGSSNGPSGEFRRPRGLVLNPANGTLYVADQGNAAIRQVAPTGMVSTLASAPFNSPAGLALDGQGNVLVADAGANTVLRITPEGLVSLLAGQDGASGMADSTGEGPAGALFNRPVALAVDGAGNVLVADQGNHAIRRIQPDGTVSTLSEAFVAPAAVALAADGSTIYLADPGNATVMTLVDGQVSALAGMAGRPGSADGTGTAAQLDAPSAIALDASGNLFVTCNGSSTICEITPAGVVTTVVGTPGSSGSAPGPLPAEIPPPWGIAVDPVTGNIYTTIDDAIMKVDFTQ